MSENSDHADRQARAYQALQSAHPMARPVPQPQKPEKTLFGEMEAMKLALGETTELSRLALRRAEEAEKKADRANRIMLRCTVTATVCAVISTLIAFFAFFK